MGDRERKKTGRIKCILYIYMDVWWTDAISNINKVTARLSSMVKALRNAARFPSISPWTKSTKVVLY